MRAALSGDIEVMRLLLEHGADPNISTTQGTTSLMAAAGINWIPGQTYSHPEADYIEAVKLCLAHGADVNASNSLGLTAMHGAANRGWESIIQILADHGARLDVKDIAGRTPYDFRPGNFSRRPSARGQAQSHGASAATDGQPGAGVPLMAKTALTCAVTVLAFAWSPANSQTPPQALLNQYCITCHNDKLKTGGLALDKLSLDHVAPNAETWEKVVRKIRAGMMPPAGARRPDRPTLDAFAASIETSLDHAAAANPNPGRAPLHRMNRGEYANAIRDLLAVDVDPATLLPADDSSNGFDNIADVLGVSPALLERYVSAAAKISRLAVGDPETSPLDVTYTVKGDLTQTVTLDGLPPGTRGGTVIHHNFPLDGEYLIKLSLSKLSFGQVFGEGAEGQELEVTIDGQRVKLYKLDEVPMFFMREIPGSPIPEEPLTDPNDANAERVRMTPNIHLEFRVKVSAGPKTIGVAFLQKSYEAIEDLVHRPAASTFDSNIGMQYGYSTVPHLARVDITGPYNATGPGDTPSRRRIFLCHPSTGADEIPCARRILSNMVRRAFRRAPADADIESLLSFYQQERTRTGHFDAGIEMALRRILADPEFVFRFEPSPAAIPANGRYRISDTELASRLSFFLWSSIPDDELLNLAIQNKLHEPAILEHQTRRMLADPRSQALAANFAGQWLYLRDLKSSSPDTREFPDFDDNLRQAFQHETEMLFASIQHEDRSVLDLLDADYTFVNERLARHYGIPGIYGPDFRRVPVPNDARRGLLGQGSMLLVTSNANRTSPVQRGKWILENLLGSPPPLPPPNVPPLKENSGSAAGASVRERMEEHRSNPVCAACHKIMDPIGLSLENFDGVGHWRATDSGLQASTRPASWWTARRIDGPSTLRKALLARPDAFVGTMTEKLLMYGVGRETKYYDMPVVRAVMHECRRADRYRFSALVLGVVKSAPFQMRVKAAGDCVTGDQGMNFITKKHLSRRTMLRGLGVSVALPLLDSMVPAQTPLAKTAAAAKTPLLRHLRSARRDDGQMDSRAGRRRLRVPREPEASRKTARPRLRGQQSRASAGQRRRFRCRRRSRAFRRRFPQRRASRKRFRPRRHDDRSGPGRAHRPGHPAAFHRNGHRGSRLELRLRATAARISTPSPGARRRCRCPWRTARRSSSSGCSAMAATPRSAFRARSRTRSILDSVTDKVARLQGKLDPSDRARLGEYLDDIREIERRIQKATEQSADRVERSRSARRHSRSVRGSHQAHVRFDGPRLARRDHAHFDADVRARYQRRDLPRQRRSRRLPRRIASFQRPRQHG